MIPELAYFNIDDNQSVEDWLSKFEYDTVSVYSRSSKELLLVNVNNIPKKVLKALGRWTKYAGAAFVELAHNGDWIVVIEQIARDGYPKKEIRYRLKR